MELHRTRSLLHDAPDIDRRIILKDCRFTGSSPDNSGTCVQIDYTLEAPSPHGNCCYCGVRLEREGIPYIDGLACDVCDARNV